MLSAGWYGVAFARIYIAEDSRIEAGRWIVAHVAKERAIGVEKGGFSMGGLVADDRKRPLDMARLFNGRPYLSCRAAIHFLGERIPPLDYIVFVDANRQTHFTAVAELYPAVAGFYTRLVAGELGFTQTARFKHYPTLGGLVFADDGVEPSFIGFDHPAVMVFKRQGDVAAALARWQRTLGDNADCPDGVLDGIGRLLAAGRDEEALQATDRLAREYPHWRPTDLIKTWIYARRGDEAAEVAAVTRYRAGFFAIEDAHYGPWASALSFAQAQLPDLALTALGEGALQVAEHQTPAPVRRAMSESYGDIARLLQQQGRADHAQVAYRLAGEMAP